MVEPGEHVSETLRKEFTEEALAKLDMPAEKRKMIADRVAYLFRNGVEVSLPLPFVLPTILCSLLKSRNFIQLIFTCKIAKLNK